MTNNAIRDSYLRRAAELDKAAVEAETKRITARCSPRWLDANFLRQAAADWRRHASNIMVDTYANT